MTTTFTQGTLITHEFMNDIQQAFAIGYTPTGTGAVATNVQTKMRESISVKDFGIVAGDVGARATNTAKLLAAWNSEGCHLLHIPYNAEPYYFNEFTLPSDKTVGLIGEDTQATTAVQLNIDASVSGIAINTGDGPVGGTLPNRFSVFKGLSIATASVEHTAFYIGNGGLTLDNLTVRAGTCIQFYQSYGARYSNLLLVSKYYCLRFGDGSAAVPAGSYNGINIFDRLNLNNGIAFPTPPVAGAAAIFVDTAPGSIYAGNNFFSVNIDTSGEGVKVLGQSFNNNYIGFWFENNVTRNWAFANTYPLGGACDQDDFIGNWYAGTPAPASPDLFPALGSRIYTGDGFFQGVTTNRVNFPVTQVPSTNPNTLDDYEEGTWEPILISDGGTITMNAAASGGLYTKVGRLVTITGVAVVTSVSSPTGNISLMGLPFVSANTLGSASPINVYAYGFEATMTTVVVGGIDQNSSSCTLQKTNGAGTVAVLGPDIKAGTSINFSCTYMTA